jgi:hypothetical protein
MLITSVYDGEIQGQKRKAGLKGPTWGSDTNSPFTAPSSEPMGAHQVGHGMTLIYCMAVCIVMVMVWSFCS